MNNLFKDLHKKKVLLFDLETESVNEVFAKPWEVGFCIYENYKEILNYQAYLKWPNLNVSAGAAKHTNFNPIKVDKEGKDPKKIMDLFCNYIYNEEYILCGHNILGYDAQIINVARRELGYKIDYSFIPRILDTNAIARGWKMNLLPKDGENLIAWQYKMLNIRAKGIKTRIEVLCDEFNIEYNPSMLHSATYDISKNYQILLELNKRISY